MNIQQTGRFVATGTSANSRQPITPQAPDPSSTATDSFEPSEPETPTSSVMESTHLRAGLTTGAFVGLSTGILGAMLANNFGIGIAQGFGLGMVGGVAFCGALGALTPRES